MNTQLKRMLSVMLSLVMIFTAAPWSIERASAAGETILNNGDFEDGNTIWKSKVDTTKGADGTVSVQGGIGTDGGRGLLFDIKNDGTVVNAIYLYQELTNLAAPTGTTFTLTFDAKVSGVDSYTFQRIWLRSSVANVNMGSQYNSVNIGTEWQTYTITITTTAEIGADTSGARLMFQTGNTRSQAFQLYLDNVALKIVEPPILANGDFEAGGDSWSLKVDTGKAANGTASIKTGYGTDGSKGILFDMVSDGTAVNAMYMTQDLTGLVVPAGTTFTLTFDAKVTGVESYNFQRIWLRSGAANVNMGAEYNAVTITGSEWQTYTVVITTTQAIGTDTNGAKLMFQTGNTGSKDFQLYLDNVALREHTDCSDIDTDSNHNCDICGKTMGSHTWVDGECNCGAKVSATVGGTQYDNLQDAVDAAIEAGSTVILTENATETITVDAGETLTLDLNGKTLAKLVVNGTFYGIDSSTKDYTNTNYGKIAVIEGNVAAIHRVDDAAKAHVYNGYAAYKDADNAYSFHYFEVKIASVVLRPTVAGIGYKLYLAGNTQIKELLDADNAFGVKVYIKDHENNGVSASAGANAFAVGAQTKMVMIDNIMSSNNEAAENATYGTMKICVDAYLQIGGEKVDVSFTSGKSLRDVVETANGKLGTYNDVQTNALKTMYTDCKMSNEAFKDWNISNIADLVNGN